MVYSTAAVVGYITVLMCIYMLCTQLLQFCIKSLITVIWISDFPQIIELHVYMVHVHVYDTVCNV